jgi:hypothetical protein
MPNNLVFSKKMYLPNKYGYFLGAGIHLLSVVFFVLHQARFGLWITATVQIC